MRVKGFFVNLKEKVAIVKHLLFLVLLVSLSASAQKINTFYFKKGDVFVGTKDEADYIRIITVALTKGECSDVKEYYRNDLLKREGKSSSSGPHISWEGNVVSYDTTGTKLSDITYKKGLLSGEASFYYNNGQLKKTLVYGVDTGMDKVIDIRRTIKYKLANYYAPNGTELLKNGNGFISEVDTENDLAEEGNYVNGLKDGIWKGVFKKDNAYEEVFKGGEFVSGKVKLADGTVNEYSKDAELPDYRGGMTKFYEYFARNYKYPPMAREGGIGGRLLISFVVEKDGSLSGINLLKDLGYGTGEEALRVIRETRRWVPGRQHGVPVKVSFTLPIQLQMTSSPSRK